MPWIYMVTNKNNGKMYIGQTVKKNPFDRWKQHKSGQNGAKYLISSIKTHGEDAKQLEDSRGNFLLKIHSYFIIKYNIDDRRHFSTRAFT